MNPIGKKIAAGVLAGAFLLSGAALLTVPQVMAAPPGEPPTEQMSKADLDQLAKEIADQYGVSQSEVRASLGEGLFLDDVYYAAMLAKVSGKSYATVIGMKQDWFDVMKKLGVTREQWGKVMRDMMAEDIASRSNLEKSTVLQLMKERYRPRDIRVAGRLANAAKKDVRDVLAMKTLNKGWRDVAKELNVDPKLVMPRTPQEQEEDAEPAAEPGAEQQQQ